MENNFLDAVKSKNYKKVIELLKHGANPNTTTSYGKPALFFVLEDYSLIKILVDFGADINSVWMGKTIFDHIKYDSLESSVVTLGEKNAIQNYEEYTPLCSAITSENIEEIEGLLKAGANVNEFYRCKLCFIFQVFLTM